jgi:hypothetical protein
LEVRLQAGDEPWREREVAALTGFGDAIVFPLGWLVASSGYEPVRVAASDALTRIGTRKASETLVRSLLGAQRDAGTTAKATPAGVIGCVLLALAGLLLIVGMVAVDVPVLVVPTLVVAGVLVLAAVIFMIEGRRGVRRTRVDLGTSLETLRNPLAAGTLAVAYADHELQKNVGRILREVLPEVTEEHSKSFDESQRAAIVALLDTGDAWMVRGALFAISRFGGEEAVEPVRRCLSIQLELQRRVDRGDAVTAEDRDLIENLQPGVFTGSYIGIAPGLGQATQRIIVADNRPPDIVQVAEAALNAILRRAALQAEGATLLRAAEVANPEADELLRPAAGNDNSNPEQLTRSSEPPEQPPTP